MKIIQKQEKQIEEIIQQYKERKKNAYPSLNPAKLPDPITYFRNHGISLCWQLEELFRKILNKQITHQAILAARETGKTFGLALIGLWLFAVEHRDIFIAGGSGTQAKKGKRYISQFLRLFPELRQEVEKETIGRVDGKHGQKILAFNCATTNIRGEHAEIIINDETLILEQTKRDAMIIIDEEAEIKSDEILPALLYIAGGTNSIIVRMSTAHHAYGSFRELIDGIDESLYSLSKWDKFDTCNIAHINWNQHINEWAEYQKSKKESFAITEEKIQTMIEALDFYYADHERRLMQHGFTNIFDILNHLYEDSSEKFLVECMAGLAGGEDAVIKPIEIIDNAIMREIINNENWSHELWIDPGKKSCPIITVARNGQHCYIVAARMFKWIDIQDKIDYCKEQQKQYHCEIAYIDIGYGYDMIDMLKYFIQPVPVSFNKLKEINAGKLQWLFENKLIHIPAMYKLMIEQLKGWHRKNGKIEKEEDHYPDACVAGMEGNSLSVYHEPILVKKPSVPFQAVASKRAF